MVEKKQVYLCETNGTIVESLWDGGCDISSCGQPMKKLEPNTVDAATEKHVPVIERDGISVTVKVGDVAHPMTPQHYILFVEILSGNNVYRHDFKESDTVAEATFLIDENETELVARAYCNLHGFWSSQ